MYTTSIHPLLSICGYRWQNSGLEPKELPSVFPCGDYRWPLDVGFSGHNTENLTVANVGKLFVEYHASITLKTTLVDVEK